MKYTESFEKLCGSCPHQNCCTNSQEPLVFGKDFEDLKKIGKANENYLKKITIKGMQVNAIKRKENSTNCIFWDDSGKKCSIYSQRPFDCRDQIFKSGNNDERGQQSCRVSPSMVAHESPPSKKIYI